MQRPNLNKMYETFIRIGLPNTVLPEQVFEMVRTKVSLTVRQLEKDGIVNWYSFIIHNRESGSIPTSLEDRNLYFHIRVSLSGNNDLESLKKSLKDYCEMTRPSELQSVDHIDLSEDGKIRFNTSLLRHEGIEEVWRIMGEQSEFVLKVFDSFKDNIVIPTYEISLFLHYFHGMFGLS